MSKYEQVKKYLKCTPKTWLVTGVAGFIGSNILEELLNLNQEVIGIDNLSTGSAKNLEEVKLAVDTNLWSNFTFFKDDIENIHLYKNHLKNTNYILHQAALGSVPKSLTNPLETHHVNASSTVNLFSVLRDFPNLKTVFASSSSVYGDSKILPKREELLGRVLSPYAASKLSAEIHADVFNRCYGLKILGLRYFNVFGKRQNPSGDYAAVIPKWISSMIENNVINIYGDGETSRDFTHVSNIVQANILAACSTSDFGFYNVACGSRITLNELFFLIKDELKKNNFYYSHIPEYKEFRVGDVQHSIADIEKIKTELGYLPSVNFIEGLRLTLASYQNKK